MSQKRVWARIAFLILVSLLTIAFVSQVDQQSIPRIENLDKLVHFAAFALLAFTFHRAFSVPTWLALIILTSYGLAIEWVQSILPYRSASMADLLADGAGVLAYYGLALFIQRWRQQQPTPKQD